VRNAVGASIANVWLISVWRGNGNRNDATGATRSTNAGDIVEQYQNEKALRSSPLRTARHLPTPGVSFFVAVVLLVGLIPGIVKCRQADVGLGIIQKKRLACRQLRISYGSIWASPYGAHGLFTRWRSRQHALFHNDQEGSHTCLKVFARRRQTTHGVRGIRSPGCNRDAMMCERPFPERRPPGACNACSCK
jgi:hypothetical protein